MRTKKLSRRTALQGLSALALAPVAMPALAQSGRSITMLHGFTPGANVDTIARLVADNLSKRIHRQIVVEGRPGAGGTTSAAAVARSPGDGSVLTILPGGHAVSAAIYKQLPYDTVGDFTFISVLTEFSFIFVTYPDHPAKTIQDVIKTAQAEPGKLTCATAGNGSTMHLALELFASMANAKIQHVPYRGSPQGITDLIAKRVDFQMDTPTVLMPFIADGRLRPLAVTPSSRFFLLPDVPTFAESGVPGYEVSSWLGIAGPKGLPADFVQTVNAEVRAILADPAIMERIRGFGGEARPSTPDQFRARVAGDVEKWTKVVAAANIPRV